MMMDHKRALAFKHHMHATALQHFWSSASTQVSKHAHWQAMLRSQHLIRPSGAVVSLKAMTWLVGCLSSQGGCVVVLMSRRV